MKKTIALLAALALGALLSACGDSVTPEPPDAPSTAISTAPPTVAPPTVAPPTDDSVGVPGEAASYPGLEVTMTDPKPYKPTEVAAGVDGFSSFVTFDVKVKNTGDKSYDPTLFMVSLSSGGEEGGQVFDENLDISPSTAVLPGKKIKWAVAFGVKDPTDLTIQLTPGFDYDASVFQVAK